MGKLTNMALEKMKEGLEYYRRQVLLAVRVDEMVEHAPHPVKEIPFTVFSSLYDYVTADVPELPPGLLSQVMRTFAVPKMTRKFDARSGAFIWTGDSAKNNLTVSITVHTSASCRVEKVETTEAVTRYRSVCDDDDVATIEEVVGAR